MIIKHDKPGIKPALGWSGGDGMEHALERIKNLVNKCVVCGEMLLRDGEGYLSPTALKTEKNQEQIEKTIKKLTSFDSKTCYPPFDDDGNPTPGRWFNDYDNVFRAFRNVMHVSLFGNIAPDLSILDMEKDLARTFIKSLKDIRPMTYEDWIAIKNFSYKSSSSESYTPSMRSIYSMYPGLWDKEPEEEEEEFHRITEEEYTDYLLEKDRKRLEEEVKRSRQREREGTTTIPWYKDPDQRDRSYEYNPDWWKKHVDNLPF